MAECNPDDRSGMICRRNHPGLSACTEHGGEARCLKTIPHTEPYFAPFSPGVLIRKRGYFYRPNWCGYTSVLGEAGRYESGVAKRHAATTEGVTVHEISEFMDTRLLGDNA